MKFKPSVGVLLKTVLPTVAGLVVLVVVIAALSGFFSEKIAPGAVPREPRALGSDDQTYQVHEVSKDYIEEAVGTLKAASRTAISARVLATINKVTVRAGDTVNEKDVLVELDRQDVEAQVSRAEASLAEAVAALGQARDEYDRAVQLRAPPSRAITQAEFNAASSRLKMAEAKEQQAEQAVVESKALRSYTTIAAPKAGVVVDRLAEPGDMAQPGVPLLVLYDPTSLRLEVPVMENLIGKVREGDKLTVVIDALGNREFVGTVDEKVPQAQAASRSFLVKVSLPSSEELYEEMFGRLKIPAGQRSHLCLATAAIQRVGQLEFVDVVIPAGDEPKSGDRLERRFIKTGRKGMEGRVEVLSGLKAGEYVVLRSSSDALQGTPPGAEGPGADE